MVKLDSILLNTKHGNKLAGLAKKFSLKCNEEFEKAYPDCLGC